MRVTQIFRRKLCYQPSRTLSSFLPPANMIICGSPRVTWLMHVPIGCHVMHTWVLLVARLRCYWLQVGSILHLIRWVCVWLSDVGGPLFILEVMRPKWEAIRFLSTWCEWDRLYRSTCTVVIFIHSFIQSFISTHKLKKLEWAQILQHFHVTLLFISSSLGSTSRLFFMQNILLCHARHRFCRYICRHWVFSSFLICSCKRQKRDLIAFQSSFAHLAHPFKLNRKLCDAQNP